MSQITSQPPPDQEKLPAAGGADDPLSHLHKMSTTAGLGSGDYVAINGTAVFALILGVASALLLLEEWVLLVIPLAGIVTAIVALRQISHSNATETGRGLAILGLLLSLAFGGFFIYLKATERARTGYDRAAIGELIHQFGETAKNSEFDKGYALFSRRFQDRVPQEQFTDLIKKIRDYPGWGKLQGATWNQLVELNHDDATGVTLAATQMRLAFEKASTPSGVEVFFRKDRDKWLIENIPSFFPAKDPAQKGQPGQP